MEGLFKKKKEVKFKIPLDPSNIENHVTDGRRESWWTPAEQ